MAKFCANCGKMLEDDMAFCINCGQKCEDPYASPTPAAPADVPQPDDTLRTVAADQPTYQQPVYQEPVQQPVYQQPAYQQPVYQENMPTQYANQPAPIAYPAPNGQQPAPKKSKKGLIIGLIIGGVAILAAVIILLFVFVFNKDDDTGSKSSSTSSSSVEKDSSKGEKEGYAYASKKPSDDDDDDDDVDADDPLHGEDNVTLTVFASDPAKLLTERLCEEFKAQYPNKDIDINVKVSGEYDASSILINDPDAADVFAFANDQLYKLHDADLLLPVSSDYLSDVRMNNTGFSVDGATDDGEVMAYPLTGENGYYLVYDRSVISDEDAQTLEGILAACRKAKRKFVLDGSNGFYSCIFSFTGGLRCTGVSGDDQLFNAYDEDSVLDSLEAFSKLLKEYDDVILSDEVSRIGSGMADKPPTVAAGIDGSWNVSAVKTALGENFGAAKLPTIKIKGQDTQLVSVSGCKLMGVNSRTSYPYTAQALANYLTNADSQTARLEDLNWTPSNTEALSSVSATNDPAISALIDQTQYAVSQSDIALSFWNEMGMLGRKVVAGESRANLRKSFLNLVESVGP